ncbi:putative protein Red [Penaeus vannamei]|uniref:RED-like N-terminal domain-containing protein n=1 Tax=Penaeus vannamei TaxID=6689 RepID=A0A3R7QTF6_PENVA|nr:putative protein Red [Penaeus vannamei]
MPQGGEEVFSNPLAPPGETLVEERPQRLTNADFRKLLMTPRAPAGSQKEPVSSVGAKTSSAEPPTQRRENKDDVRAAERKKKKSYYAKIKKEEEEKMAELAEKYRDRAKERRDGKNPDYQAEDPSQAGMGGYRAVAPDLKSGLDAAERRKQMIQESKFLGGDMEHTHLVKGLDYALLQKVRSEIQLKESEVMVEVEKPAEGTKEKKPPPVQPPMPPPQEEDELTFKTNVGRRIFNAVFNSKQSDFVDLFLPGRMAYAIDLDDEVAESDIPTTIIRSKADLQGIENMQATFTTNDIVIQKLTQILSYLRTGRANKKQKKKDKGKNEAAPRVGALPHKPKLPNHKYSSHPMPLHSHSQHNSLHIDKLSLNRKSPTCRQSSTCSTTLAHTDDSTGTWLIRGHLTYTYRLSSDCEHDMECISKTSRPRWRVGISIINNEAMQGQTRRLPQCDPYVLSFTHHSDLKAHVTSTRLRLSSYSSHASSQDADYPKPSGSSPRTNLQSDSHRQTVPTYRIPNVARASGPSLCPVILGPSLLITMRELTHSRATCESFFSSSFIFASFPPLPSPPPSTLYDLLLPAFLHLFIFSFSSLSSFPRLSPNLTFHASSFAHWLFSAASLPCAIYPLTPLLADSDPSLTSSSLLLPSSPHTSHSALPHLLPSRSTSLP